MDYLHIAQELLKVKPFQAGFRSQDVPRIAAVLHPPFAKTLAHLVARFVDTMSRVSYKTFTLEGIENFPKPDEHAIIFAPNHLSYLDPPLIGAVTTRYFKKNPWFMAKKRLWLQLNYRLSFALLGGVPFRRKTTNEEEFIKNLKPFVSLLKSGEHLVVFPEGTIPGEFEKGKGSIVRNRSDVTPETGLLSGGPLIPLLVAVTGARVIPIGVSGTGRAFPPEVMPGKVWKGRKKKNYPVKVAIGKPLDLYKDLQKTLQTQKENFTRIYLKELNNKKIMPAISHLIDFSLHEVPLDKLPLDEEDFLRIQKFEENVYDLYAQKGYLDSSDTSPNPPEKMKHQKAG